MRYAAALCALVVLAGCHERQDPARKAREDSRDVAKVETLQKADPPRQPFALEPLTPDDLARPDFTGMGCVFDVPWPPAPDSNPMVFANGTLAAIRWNGVLATMASDAGSTRNRAGLYSHYTGKTNELRITLRPGEPEAAGEEATRWLASAVLFDAYQREIWHGDGALTCGV